MKGNAKEIIGQMGKYVDRIIQIRLLSTPQLDEINTADAYVAALSENFTRIGEMAAENRAFLADYIDPYLKSKEPFPEEIAEALRTLNEGLMDVAEAENIDLPIVFMVSDRLKQDAMEKHDRDALIRQLDEEIGNCYLLEYMTIRIAEEESISRQFRDKGLKALESMLKYLEPEEFLKLNEESRALVLQDSRYGALLYDGERLIRAEEARKRIELLENSLALAENPFYQEAAPDYDMRYHRYRIYEYLTMMILDPEEKELQNKIAGYADRLIELWMTDPEYYSEFGSYEDVIGLKLDVDWHAGRISREEILQELYQHFQERDPGDYSYEGIGANLEYPANYCSVLDPNALTDTQKERVSEIYRSALAYVFHMPKLGLFSSTNMAYAGFLRDFIEIPGAMTFEEFGLQSMAAFHPPTYIHSKMVAKISRTLAEHLMEMGPELFLGICDCHTIEEVEDHATEILDFVYHAALCHDFGKLIIIDTIFVYGRRLFDLEFDIIKQHPRLGKNLLKRCNSTREYADVALGHHVWYDGSKGYPTEFDISGSPYRTVINIVECADCMDAATDTIGRSYNRGKTFDDFEEEVRQGSGNRYAPYFPKLFLLPEVRKDLLSLLSEGRKETYAEAFHLLRNV